MSGKENVAPSKKWSFFRRKKVSRPVSSEHTGHVGISADGSLSAIATASSSPGWENFLARVAEEQSIASAAQSLVMLSCSPVTTADPVAIPSPEFPPVPSPVFPPPPSPEFPAIPSPEFPVIPSSEFPAIPSPEFLAMHSPEFPPPPSPEFEFPPPPSPEFLAIHSPEFPPPPSPEFPAIHSPEFPPPPSPISMSDWPDEVVSAAETTPVPVTTPVSVPAAAGTIQAATCSCSATPSPRVQTEDRHTQTDGPWDEIGHAIRDCASLVEQLGRLIGPKASSSSPENDESE